jgi:hypothetical protein
VLFGRHEIGQVVQKTSGIKAKHADWNPPGNFKVLVERMRRDAVDMPLANFSKSPAAGSNHELEPAGK